MAFAIRDKFPVTPLHGLDIPKRYVADYFECTSTEREAIHALLVICRSAILIADVRVGGGNVGATAGQKIHHVHVHLIPGAMAASCRLWPACKLIVEKFLNHRSVLARTFWIR
ncbi:MAG TPA: HIT family protein [Methylocella sp.]|nr:HIT family protein [Methylocella sp.]